MLPYAVLPFFEYRRGPGVSIGIGTLHRGGRSPGSCVVGAPQRLWCHRRLRRILPAHKSRFSGCMPGRRLRCRSRSRPCHPRICPCGRVIASAIVRGAVGTIRSAVGRARQCFRSTPRRDIPPWCCHASHSSNSYIPNRNIRRSSSRPPRCQPQTQARRSSTTAAVLYPGVT